MAAPETAFICRELYGGAMTAEIPASYMDVSAMRQVPDNQEAWADSASDDSLIFELLEPPKGLPDEGAAGFFWRDLAEAAGASGVKLLKVETLDALACAPALCAAVTRAAVPGGHLAGVRSPAVAASLAEGTQLLERERSDAGRSPVHVALAAMRLPGTDLLVVVNRPDRPAAQEGILRRVVGSLHILDFGLFGPPCSTDRRPR